MSALEKTNIVFILADDLAVWAAGCYGNAEIRTPNLDRMAATGVRFENFFVTIPVCSASRASFLTGADSVSARRSRFYWGASKFWA